MSPPPGHRDGWRIIATDDNTSKLSAIVQTLRDAGHCVFAAYDGRSALELITQIPDIDLLITNTRLGAVDGPELMRQTRAVRPGIAILHVVHHGDAGTTAHRRTCLPCESRSRRTTCLWWWEVSWPRRGGGSGPSWKLPTSCGRRARPRRGEASWHGRNPGTVVRPTNRKSKPDTTGRTQGEIGESAEKVPTKVPTGRMRCGAKCKWALLDSNQRPTDYESAALTT